MHAVPCSLDGLLTHYFLLRKAAALAMLAFPGQGRRLPIMWV
jgi:hypothetical protein